MAKSSARVVLNGRFPPGARVELVAVASEAVLRTSPADRVVEAKTVDESGRVEFTKGITNGGRYFVRGQKDGFPLEVRITGRVPDTDTDSVNAVAPVGTEPRRFSGGDPVDPDGAVLVAQAEEAKRVADAGPVGSDSEADELAAIRSEKDEPVVIQSGGAKKTTGTRERTRRQREEAAEAANDDEADSAGEKG